MQLRPYQLECLEAINAKAQEGICRQLVVLPTGSGKTVIFSELIKQKKLKTLVIAHRIELLEQAQNKIMQASPEIETGIFCGDLKCHDKQVTIASIQSASNHLDLLKAENYQLLIIDEAHHAGAKSYRTLLWHLDFIHNPNEDQFKLLVGFTATPSRSDGRGLDEVFQEVVYHVSIRKLVNRGFLVKPEGLHVTVGVDLTKVYQKNGDFDKKHLQKVMLEEEAIQVVVDTISSQAKDRRGIVFSVDIHHAEVLKERIQKAGFNCGVVHSQVSMEDRQNRLKAFANGDLQFITNPMILTEGFDCPVADCMINAAPTLNRSLYIQKAGRVLRIHPEKKDALLIDFGFIKKKHALRTALDLFGDAKMRKIMDGRELRPKASADKKNIDFRGVEFDPVEKEEYDPLNASNAIDNHGSSWVKKNTDGRERYSLIINGMSLLLLQCKKRANEYGVFRYVQRNGSEKVSKEFHGFHERSKAFQLADTLKERPKDMMDFAKDPNAKWRKDKATDRQLAFLKSLLRSKRLNAEIDFSSLTKGKASDYISGLQRTRSA